MRLPNARNRSLNEGKVADRKQGEPVWSGYLSAV
jgi:hypothetical protein